MVQITENAAKEVKRLVTRDGKPNAFLRLQVVGGGCSGMSYKLSFETSPGESDKVFEGHGVKVLVDPKSLLFVNGIQIDFSDGLDGTGFSFTNPNAKKSCGCGTSFSA